MRLVVSEDDADLAQKGLKKELYAVDIAGDGAVDRVALEFLNRHGLETDMGLAETMRQPRVDVVVAGGGRFAQADRRLERFSHGLSCANALGRTQSHSVAVSFLRKG